MISLMFGGAILIARTKTQVIFSSEPTALGPLPIRASFGSGEGVTYEHAHFKSFTLMLALEAPEGILLHFQAREVGQGDILLEVNGQTVASVPANSTRLAGATHQVLLPGSLLKRGERNEVVFRSTHNPAEHRPWRIWNVSVETIPLPQLPSDQLVLEAESAFRRAELSFAQRDVAIPNRYLAWRDYRAAWILLEAHPGPKPDLYWLTKDKVLETQGELDRTCAKLRVEIMRFASQKQWEFVYATAEQMKLYFPNDDQPCRRLTQRTLLELKW